MSKLTHSRFLMALAALAGSACVHDYAASSPSQVVYPPDSPTISQDSSTPPADPSTAPPAPSAVAPVPSAVPNYPRTGGTSISSAEVVPVDGVVEGVVDPGAQVFYRFDAVKSDVVTFTTYSEKLVVEGGPMMLSLRLLDEQGGRLGESRVFTTASFDTTDLDRTQYRFQVESSGPVIMQLTAQATTVGKGSVAVHFKIVSAASK